MKKLITCLATLLLIPGLYAQITINEMPDVGDDVMYKVINENTFDPLPTTTGVNVTWDYTGIYERSDTIIYSYIDPSTTPEADSFPTSMVAEATEGITGHFFFSSDAGAFYRDGFYTADLQIFYSNKLKLCQLPFEFGDDYTDTYAGNGWMTGVPNPVTIDDGSFYFEVQGVGTLRMPSGYWDSVFRVYYEEEFSVKTDLGIGSPVTVLTINEFGYEYWKPGVVKPILTYYSTNITDLGVGNTTEEAARWQKWLTPDGTNPSSIAEVSREEITVSPNPANDLVKVSISSGMINKVEMIDMLGKTMFSKDVAAHVVSINVSSYRSGIYFIRIWNDQNQLTTRKLVVE